VSIHKELLSIGRQAIIGRARQAAQPSNAVTPGVSQAGVVNLPALVPAARSLLQRFGPSVGIGAVTGIAGSLVGGAFSRNADGSCPVGTHPIKQDGVHGPKGSYCVRNRRMNVGNSRAARRSVRRLKGARKLLRDIEKMMPSKTTRRRAPQHHHHPAAGGS